MPGGIHRASSLGGWAREDCLPANEPRSMIVDHGLAVDSESGDADARSRVAVPIRASITIESRGSNCLWEYGDDHSEEVASLVTDDHCSICAPCRLGLASAVIQAKAAAAWTRVWSQLQRRYRSVAALLVDNATQVGSPRHVRGRDLIVVSSRPARIRTALTASTSAAPARPSGRTRKLCRFSRIEP